MLTALEQRRELRPEGPSISPWEAKWGSGMGGTWYPEKPRGQEAKHSGGVERLRQEQRELTVSNQEAQRCVSEAWHTGGTQ